MSRFPRVVLPGVPLHIIQRGNNRNPCFFCDADFQVYRSMLAEYSGRFTCAVHAYILMSNHVHLLATPLTATSASSFMKHVGQAYVQYINRRHQRFGTLWQGRFRSCLVAEENYFLVCQRYIELNPVRAGIVEHPADYEWSSYQANAYGKDDPVVSPHPAYLGISETSDERQASYRALFKSDISDDQLDQIRFTANKNAAFGPQTFIDEVGASAAREMLPQSRGRKSFDER
jgi:putative transposase